MILDINDYNLKLEIEDNSDINKKEFEQKVTQFLNELEEKDDFIYNLIRLYGIGHILNELDDNFDICFYVL